MRQRGNMGSWGRLCEWGGWGIKSGEEGEDGFVVDFGFGLKLM